MGSSGSFSQMLSRLKDGDDHAVEALWNRFFEPLQKLAINRLNAQDRKTRDEEDLALSAINAFQQCVKNGRYDQIEDRFDVWHLLVTIVERKVIDHVRKEHAKKRGAGNVHGDSFSIGLNHFAEFGLNHEEKIDFLDQLNSVLNQLEDPELTQVVYAKIEGFSNSEIAEKIGRSVSSVERKLRLARQIWSKAEKS